MMDQNKELLASKQVLEAERSKYLELFEFAPDGYLVTDAHGNILEVNQAAAALFHLEKEFIIRKPLDAFISPEDHKFFFRQLHTLQNGNETEKKNWKITLRPRVEKAFHASLSVKALPDTMGNITGLLWLVRDNSERVRAEKRLQDARDNLELEVGERTQELRNELEERKKLKEERARTQERQARILQISQKVLGEKTIGGLLQVVVEAACELSGAKKGIAGHGFRDGTFEIGGTYGIKLDETLPLSDLLAIQNGGVYLDLIDRTPSLRLTDEQLRLHPAWKGLSEGHTALRGLLGARLVGSDGSPVGMVMVTDKESGEFAAEDEAALSQLVALASLGLQNIQAKNDAEGHADELEALVNALVGAVFVWNAEGRMVKANPAAVDTFGDLIGVDIDTFIHRLQIRQPDGRPMLRQDLPVQRALSGEMIKGGRIIVTDKDSHTRRILATASPLWREWHIAGVVVAWWDITEREELLEQLDAERSRWKATVENIPEMVVVSDAEGRITFANPSALEGTRERDYQIQLQQKIDEQPPIQQVTHPDGRPFNLEEMPLILAETKNEAVFDIEMVHHAGSVMELRTLWNAAPIRDELGNKTGVVAVGRDITELYRIEEELRKARDELELRVLERIAELGITNEQLKVENLDRMRAEESLRLANAYNRSLLEASLDPLVTISQDGKIGDVNEATELATGYSRTELIGTDFHSYFTEPEKARAGYQQVFERGTVHNYELEMRHKDGRQTPVLYNATVYCDEKGEVRGVFAAARDITEIRRAEKQIRLQTTTLEAAANGIFITDVYGNILWSNPAFAEITGFSFEETLGQNPRLLKSGLQNPEFYQEMWTTILSGEVWHGVITNRRKDGSLYIEDQTITPVRDETGLLSYFIAIKQDITDHKRAEVALEEDHKRLLKLSQTEREQRLFAESLALATLAVNSSLDLNQVLDHILEQIQAAIPFRTASIGLLEGEKVRIARQRGFGAPGETAVSLDGDFPIKDYGLWLAIRDSRKVLSVQDLQLDSRWNPVPVLEWARSYIGVPLVVGEQVTGFLNVFSDRPDTFSQEVVNRLTAFASQAALAIQNARLYKNLENALSQEQSVRNRLVQSEKFAAMGRMLGSVAHELNNPLQTIKNCLYLTKNEVPNDSPIQEYVEMASDETRRLANLVAQLRSFYHPLPKTEMYPLDINEILDEVHALILPQLRDSKVTWLQSPGPQNLKVTCESDQIKQVFINICTNAMEAMGPDGGSLRIALALSEDNSQVRVAFQDSGPGIPPETANRLFEPFFTTKAAGLGLGLSICLELVQRYQGNITVDSEFNHGTTFTVWLPLSSVARKN